MEDKNLQVEATMPEKKVEVDYDRINSHINAKVETEVGKFIKTFIENNGYDKPKTEEAITTPEPETEEEREIKEWRI